MSREFLKKVVGLKNVASILDDEDLLEIGSDVWEDFDRDMRSRSEWDKKTEEAKKLASLESEYKNFPFEGASNTKLPYLTQSIIQFAARTYPQYINNGRCVEFKVNSFDPDGSKSDIAKRLSRYHSWQLLYKSETWETETDKLFQLVALYGIVFRKTYYDPFKGMPVSELCLPEEIYVNNFATSLEDSRRVSHVIRAHRNDIVSRSRSGLYVSDIEIDDLAEVQSAEEEEDLHYLIEQHCYLDLDGDGYEEPYIVVIHRDSRKVLRIVARFDFNDIIFNAKDEVVSIKPTQYFTAFICIPALDGTFYALGYGHLLLTLNETINSITNMLLDSGTLANSQIILAGREVKIPGGQLRVSPGEIFKLDSVTGADLQKSLFPLNYKEPSTGLFNLLQLVIEAAKDLSSATDMLLGRNPGQNTPAATSLAIEKQSLQVYSSIQKRLYRSFKQEYSKIFELNKQYLDLEEYSAVLNLPVSMIKDDFQLAGVDVLPIADPNLSSETQKMARIQAVLPLITDPRVNGLQVLEDYFNVLDIPQPERYINTNPAPDPKMIDTQAKATEKHAKAQHILQDAQNKRVETIIKALKTPVELAKEKSQAIKNVADAKAAEHEAHSKRIDAEAGMMDSVSNRMNAHSGQVDSVTAQVDAKTNLVKHILDMLQEANNADDQQSTSQDVGDGSSNPGT